MNKKGPFGPDGIAIHLRMTGLGIVWLNEDIMSSNKRADKIGCRNTVLLAAQPPLSYNDRIVPQLFWRCH